MNDQENTLAERIRKPRSAYLHSERSVNHKPVCATCCPGVCGNTFGICVHMQYKASAAAASVSCPRGFVTLEFRSAISTPKGMQLQRLIMANVLQPYSRCGGYIPLFCCLLHAPIILSLWTSEQLSSGPFLPAICLRPRRAQKLRRAWTYTIDV